MADNIDDFIRQHLPRGKRSRLFPHLPDIRRLRGEGFSFEQIGAYLASKGVVISASGLASYLKRRGADLSSRDTLRPRVDAGERSTQGDAQNGPSKQAAEEGFVPMGEGTPLSSKSRRERIASKFISETTNSVLKIMEKKQ